MTLIESKLQALREEYKTATPDRKRQIVIVANRIKQSAGLYKEKVNYNDPFKKLVVKNLM
jgi:hypothetical protein